MAITRLGVNNISNSTIANITALPAGVSGLDYLGRTTISSGVTTVDITFDTTNYASFKFILNGVRAVTDGVDYRLRYSVDGGSSFQSGGTDYGYIGNAERVSGAYQVIESNNTGIFYLTSSEARPGTDTKETPSFEVNLWNDQDYPKINVIGGTYNSAANYSYWFRSGVFNTTSTVNALRFDFSSGNFASGTIDTYGFSK